MKREVTAVAGKPAVKFVPVTIGGQEYKLAFDFNALCEGEALTGLNLLTGISGLFAGGISLSNYRAILYVALRMGLPEITLERAGELCQVSIEDLSMSTVLEALREASGFSFEKTVPPKAAPPAKDSGN